MPASAARVIQLNSTGEGTWGTLTAATRKLFGVTSASFKIADKAEMVPTLGYLGPSAISAETAQHAEGSLEFLCTYQDMPIIYNGMFTAINQSSSIASPWVYPYTAPVTSTQVCYTYTIEHGTSSAAYRAVGSVFNDLSIKGEAGGFWTASVGMLAKQVTSTAGAWTALTSDRPAGPTPIRMADTKLYLDAITGTIGGTTAAATLISFELAIKPGRHLKTFAGSLYPTNWGDGRYDVTLKLTAEFNATAKAVVDELLGSTGAAVRRLIRIESTQGSTYVSRLDFAGIKVDGETLYGDRDGNMTVDLSFQGIYSTGVSTGNYFAAQITHESSSTTT